MTPLSNLFPLATYLVNNSKQNNFVHTAPPSGEFIVNKTFIWPPYTFQAGVAVTPSPAQMGTTLVKMMKSKGLA